MRLAPRFSALDFKVGFRMLARYPWLTVVGTIAIAVAIALGTVYFEATDKFRHPRLPIADADRVVSLHSWDLSRLQETQRLLNDFSVWRKELKSVHNLGAAITFVRNLRTEDGRIEPVMGAEMSASGFRIMGTAPLLGRALADRDESPGEPPVVVIGERIWKSRFDSDPRIIGRVVDLGTARATIVGVMPESFGFPVNHHIWTPLRVDGSTVEPGSGPSVSVFGRLAPGASMNDARAELAVVGARMSAAHPATHEHLRPRVTAYGAIVTDGGEPGWFNRLLYVVNTVFLLLLGIMCTNVATLVFARTATRSWEMTVRSALGASRGRIVGQLFSEALVLAALGAFVGLMVARIGMRIGLGMFAAKDALPFWVDASLSWRTLLYTASITVIGAAIVGILPALRVTRVNIQDMLRNESAGRAGLKFGGFWTAIIVVQVAITVAFIPLAGGGVFEANRFNQRASGIGAERYLTASVGIDRENYALDSAVFAARARSSIAELERRLGSEPGIERVAFMDRTPVEDQFKYRITVDTTQLADFQACKQDSCSLRVSTLVNVTQTFFDTFGTSVVSGRAFQSLDFEPGAPKVLVVNEAFARHVLGQRNPIGQRIKIGEGEVDLRDSSWYEVVGMVRNFGWQLPEPQEQSAMYRPSLPVVGRAGQLAVRTRDPNAFAQRLRAIAAEVDPTIRLTDVKPLTQAGGGEAQGNWALTAVAWTIGFIVLMLSASGIHALMSFTVTRRTREIGIRVALGAGAQKIVAGIFARAFVQIGAGLIAGTALVAWAGGLSSTRDVLLLLAADAIMLTAGLVACAVPVRRALTIQPSDALRAE